MNQYQSGTVSDLLESTIASPGFNLLLKLRFRTEMVQNSIDCISTGKTLLIIEVFKSLPFMCKEQIKLCTLMMIHTELSCAGWLKLDRSTHFVKCLSCLILWFEVKNFLYSTELFRVVSLEMFPKRNVDESLNNGAYFCTRQLFFVVLSLILFIFFLTLYFVVQMVTPGKK